MLPCHSEAVGNRIAAGSCTYQIIAPLPSVTHPSLPGNAGTITRKTQKKLPSDKILETSPPLRIHHRLDLFRCTHVYCVFRDHRRGVSRENGILERTQPRRSVRERWGFLWRHDGVPDGGSSVGLSLRILKQRMQTRELDRSDGLSIWKLDLIL